jgi:transketolase
MARQINTLEQKSGKDREIRGPHPGGLRIPRSVQAGRGIGSADVRREGKDVTLLTYGLLVAEAELACDRLEERGISAGLINVRWLAPVDEAALLHAARTSALLVTIEDHFKVGGLYSILCELLVREGVTARVAPHALDGRWFKPGTLPRVLDHEGFSAAKLADRVLLAMQENT